MLRKLSKSTKTAAFFMAVILLCVGIGVNFGGLSARAKSQDGYIKWVEFGVPYSALEKALNADIKGNKENKPAPWVQTLAYLAAKYGGTWSRYKPKDMDAFLEQRAQGKTVEELTADMKYYSYYYNAYDAVLGGMVGNYQISTLPVGEGELVMETRYGLKAYSPVAYGYAYSHYDDFGNSRSYGYKRRHLGNDLIGGIGTPIVAVESGVVEVAGWNKYGGWRIGIRSFDKKRYYYYAHLRKNRPFAEGLKEGQIVNAGDVIGYLGMTGYSDSENVNGMTIPHLHFGMQLIFDESQKEGNNEIWVDVYNIVSLLQKHTSPVVRNAETKESTRKYAFLDPWTAAYQKSKKLPDTSGGTSQSKGVAPGTGASSNTSSDAASGTTSHPSAGGGTSSQKAAASTPAR